MKPAAISLRSPAREFLRTDFAHVRPDQTVDAAIRFLRGQNITTRILYIYVLETDGKIAGVVPLRRLLLSDRGTPIRDLMVARVVTVSADATLEEACDLFATHRLLALPVVDEQGRMQGLLDVEVYTDEMVDLAEKESLDNLFQMIGVRASLSRSASAWASFRQRFPWLLWNVFGGIACAFLAGFYAEMWRAFVALAMFLPVTLALAESVSMQAMAATLPLLRGFGMRGGVAHWAGYLWREIRVSLLLGAGCGLAVGLVAWLWRGDWRLGLALFSSILLAMFTAAALGAFLPGLLRRMRRDPHLASGPVTLALADLLALLLYLNLARWLLI